MTAAELREINAHNAALIERLRRAREELHAKRAALELIADRRGELRGKITRGLWCLNLLLLDGFSRAELDALSKEVDRFIVDCRELAAWRVAA